MSLSNIIKLVFISLFISFFICSVSLATNYSFSSNLSVSGGKWVNMSSSESQNNRVFYIPMEDVQNGSFFIDFTQNNFTGTVEYTRTYYSNSIPSVGVGASWSGSFANYTKISTKTDITSFVQSKYNSSYTYLCIMLDSYKSYNALDYAIITSDIPDSTPTPYPEASPFPSQPPFVNPEGDYDLSDYDFYAFTGGRSWKSGDTLSFSSYSFSPDSANDLSPSSVGNNNNTFLYHVSIPFFINCVGFDGTGSCDASFTSILSLDGAWKSSDYINSMIDIGNPWVSSSDSNISYNSAIYPINYAVENGAFAFDIYNLQIKNNLSAEFYLNFDVYLSLSSNAGFTNFANYLKVNLSDITFDIDHSVKSSDSSVPGILESIDQGIKDGNAQDKLFHDEEIQETERAIDNMNESVDQLTDTLSSWEIITLPFKVTKDLIDAITSYEGDTGITFPSFTLLDHQLWPSYTFDLKIIEEKFPILVQALHTITGIIIVGWFLHYLRFKAWSFGFF